MSKCQFRIRDWECPLEALPGEKYCYWHKEEDGKAPDEKNLARYNFALLYWATNGIVEIINGKYNLHEPRIRKSR